jgi:hypothetical protein
LPPLIACLSSKTAWLEVPARRCSPLTQQGLHAAREQDGLTAELAPHHCIERALAHLGVQACLKSGTVEDWIDPLVDGVAGVHPCYGGFPVIRIEIEGR